MQHRHPHAGGAGEQVMSRDLFRLGQRLDFFRLCSVFFSNTGYFFNSSIAMMSVFVTAWLVLVLALSDALTVTSAAGDSIAVVNSIRVMQIVQLGALSIIPYWGELCLEDGLLAVRSRDQCSSLSAFPLP